MTDGSSEQFGLALWHFQLASIELVGGAWIAQSMLVNGHRGGEHLGEAPRRFERRCRECVSVTDSTTMTYNRRPCHKELY